MWVIISKRRERENEQRERMRMREKEKEKEETRETNTARNRQAGRQALKGEREQTERKR